MVPVTPGIDTYPWDTLISGSLIVAQRSTVLPSFHATYAAYLRNSPTVERSSQPARFNPGGIASFGPTPAKAALTPIGSWIQTGRVKWFRVTITLSPRFWAHSRIDL